LEGSLDSGLEEGSDIEYSDEEIYLSEDNLDLDDAVATLYFIEHFWYSCTWCVCMRENIVNTQFNIRKKIKLASGEAGGARGLSAT
jgi:hypothetical protein